MADSQSGAGTEPIPVVARYRKRPVVINAVHLTDDYVDGWDWIAEWCGGRIYNVTDVPGAEPETRIDITTLEGVMTAVEGDWIIRGVKGEFYPCKPDIFDATYEPVNWGDDEPGDAVTRGAITYGYLAAKAQAVRLLRRYAEDHQHEGTYDGVCRAATLIDGMEPDRG